MTESGKLSEVFLGGTFNLHKSPYFQRINHEKIEIDKLKWCESERVGYDIGDDRALWIWMTRHRHAWIHAMRASGAEGF